VALARELGPRGVRVNAVAPGTTLTDMTSRVLTAPLEAAAVNRTALRRLGTQTTMIFAKSGIIILLIAIAAPAAAQTADEMKARIAALEKENAKLRERLTSRGPTSVPRKGVDRVPELAMPAKSLAVGRSAAAAHPRDAQVLINLLTAADLGHLRERAGFLEI
jgi:hypothetical protein